MDDKQSEGIIGTIDSALTQRHKLNGLLENITEAEEQVAYNLYTIVISSPLKMMYISYHSSPYVLYIEHVFITAHLSISD